jgi:hypothetical protein
MKNGMFNQSLRTDNNRFVHLVADYYAFNDPLITAFTHAD